MLIMPKKEILVPVNTQVGLRGFLRLQVLRPDGRCRYDTGFFPNTILNAGKNYMGSNGGWMDWCQVGTGTTFAPLLADRQNETSLEAHHAGTNTIQANTNGQEGSAPYFGWRRRTYRFGVGTVAANLSEVGVGWATSGSTLISRAQILDPATQTPTTVTPLADELLDVTYELRYYPPTTDTTGETVVLDGATYDITTRAANVTADDWSLQIGTEMQAITTLAEWIAYDGALGPITGEPSGTTAIAVGTISSAAYSNNSYERTVTANVGSTGWNLGSGIRCIRILTSGGAYQSSFANQSGGGTIPKSSSYTMVMKWTFGWTEKP